MTLSMQFLLTPDLFCSTFYNMQLIMGLNALMTINPQLPREIFTPWNLEYIPPGHLNDSLAG